jgi:peptidoglycan/LPS O-acetylase OafA/YrhL
MFGHSGLLWSQAANFAVQVFFALSGWLIGGMLVEVREEELPHFYFNRALRIWCPYFLALAFLITASLTLRDTPTYKWSEFIFYKSTFVYNLFGPPQLAQHRLEMPLAGTGNHFWSVNAEEQFYLVAPLILVLARRRYGRKVSTWAVLAVVAWLTRTYASIIFGVLAAVIAHTHEDFYSRHVSRLLAGLAVIASGIGLATGVNYELLSPICAIALVLLLAIHGAQHRWGALAGGMSYPLYLNAWIPVFLVNAVFKRLSVTSTFAHYAANTALDLVFAALLYWFFDRRILGLRHRLFTPKRGRIVMVIAYSVLAIGICGGFLLSRT